MKGPLFYSKILLFGEYGIIKDSKGLSIPYNFYKGALIIPKQQTAQTQESNKHLEAFCTYLGQIEAGKQPLTRFDLSQMRADLALGMYFDSSIPQGYGVGSSGALVAAIYDRYAVDKITILENLLKNTKDI